MKNLFSSAVSYVQVYLVYSLSYIEEQLKIERDMGNSSVIRFDVCILQYIGERANDGERHG